MRRLKYSFRIFLIIISMTLSVTLIFTSISTIIAGKINENLVKENLNTVTQNTLTIVDSSVKSSIKNHLRSIAETELVLIEEYYELVELGEITKEDADKLIFDFLDSIVVGETGYTYILNSSGELIYHPQLTGENILEHEFAQIQVEQKTGYIEYEWKNPDDETTRPKALYMVYFPEWDYIVSVSSYISEFLSLINTNDFREAILGIELGETGYVYVMDDTGKLIIHPFQEGVNISNSIDTEGNYFIQDILMKNSGEIIYPWINPGESEIRQKIVNYTHYDLLGWYICSGVYIDEIETPLNSMRNTLLTIGVLMAIISSIFAFRVSKTTIKPINNLIHAMNSVIESKYEVSVEVNSDDEIGELSRTFNKVTGDTKKLLQSVQTKNIELIRAKETLEQQVYERTKELNELSILDGLTNVYNRRKLNDYLKSLDGNSFTKAVYMIDIDDFKLYNDKYGHAKGDKCLQIVAAECLKVVSHFNGFFARYGGEEFMAILPDTSEDIAVELAEQLLSRIRNFNYVEANVTISIGLAISSESSIENIVATADDAMYLSKKHGKNTVTISR